MRIKTMREKNKRLLRYIYLKRP